MNFHWRSQARLDYVDPTIALVTHFIWPVLTSNMEPVETNWRVCPKNEWNNSTIFTIKQCSREREGKFVEDANIMGLSKWTCFILPFLLFSACITSPFYCLYKELFLELKLLSLYKECHSRGVRNLISGYMSDQYGHGYWKTTWCHMK